MNGGISAPFIHHPIATSLIAAAFLLVGIAAYPNLPVAPLPQIDFPTISVSAQLPGASPQTMASAVAQPLDTQFAQINGVTEMTSTSEVGSTSITLQFDLDRDIDGAANDVQSAINAATGALPKDLPSPPTYRKVNPADSPIMLIGATSTSLPIPEVDDQVNTKVSQVISQIAGVGEVIIGGQQTPAIRVQLDPDKLKAAGLSLEDARAAISVTTVNSPKGEINGPQRSYTIYDNDQLTDAGDWNNVILAYRNGAPIRIRDVGQAVSGPQDTTQAAWANGQRGIFLIIFRQPGANIVSTVDAINAALPKLKASLPPTIHLTTLRDSTQTIRASLHDVQITLLVTILLVVMVIFIFLRNVWATIIPSVTVPLALFGAFALMWWAGYSLDNLSLMALTISVGFVVDDAIVMLENISRHVEEGLSPLEAALQGASEIGFTILSISISLIAVLIPLLFMSGIIGRLFHEFAVTLAMTIAVSGFCALTITPTMASRILKPTSEVHHGKLYLASEDAFNRLISAYEWALTRALRFRFITLMVFFATLAATVVLYINIPKGFFPQQDTGLIAGTSQAAQDISPQAMMSRQEALGAIVQKDPDVASVAMSIGGNGRTGNAGQFFISLKPRGERKSDAAQIIARLRPQLAKVEGAALVLQAAQDVRIGGRQSAAQYQYTLQDSDFDELNNFAPKMLAKMKAVPLLRDVSSDQQDSGTTLTLTIDRDQASRYGIEPQLIDDTLYDAFGQREVAQYFTQLSTYYVIEEITPRDQGKPNTLNSIYLKSPNTGGEVPLSSLVHWTTVPVQPLAINHQGQFPSVTLSFNLAPNASLSDATQAIENAAAQLNMPATVTTSFQGTAQAFQQSLSSVPLLIVAALIAVYLILGVLYESYVHPLTILSTLPSAGLGALATMQIFGFDFTLISLIGIVLLIGIVKKNGIMLVDFAITGEREEGLSSEEAIKRACLMRFRPIMMTTMATLLGAVPLMLATGTGSELRQPLGYAMVGGLIVSQALTLFTTPVIYLYLDSISKRVSGLRKSRRSPAQKPKERELATAWPSRQQAPENAAE